MTGSTRPKGYNNDTDWEKMENKNLKTQVIDLNEQLFETEDFEASDSSIFDNTLNIENVINEDEDILKISEEDDSVQILEVSSENEDFSEVLALTQYDDKMLNPAQGNFTLAEYEQIKTAEIAKVHEISAKKFVAKITKFILEFNDMQLTTQHQNYLKDVANFQVQHLSDLLYLVDVNKKMLNNIIARVNATTADDYAILNSYNMLANQHLKFIKELQSTYKSIPGALKRMRTEIMSNQDLEGLTSPQEELGSENLGETHFNNGKQMLRKMIESRNNSQKTSEEEAE